MENIFDESKMHSDQQIQADNPDAVNPGQMNRSSNQDNQMSGKNQRNGKPDPNKNKNRNRGQSKNGMTLGEKLKKTQQEYENLQKQVSQRVEKTPTFGIKDDTVVLQFEGKVADKRTVRYAPLLKGDEVRLIWPIIEPIVHLANAALRGHDIEDRTKVTELGPDGKSKDVLWEGKPVYKCDWAVKARYAYGRLIADPEIAKNLLDISTRFNKLMKDSSFISVGQLDHNIPESVAKNPNNKDTYDYLENAGKHPAQSNLDIDDR
jgi:hypothetical protein